MHGFAEMLCNPRNRYYGQILCAMFITILLNISFFYEMHLFHHPLQWLKDESVQSVKQKDSPSPITNELLERCSIILNCSVMSIPSEWLNNNSTLVQLGQNIGLRDCRKSDDIRQIFDTRNQILTRECKYLVSEEKDLHRSTWTWQSTGTNGYHYLDKRKKYRICKVPKAGFSSWSSNIRKLRGENLQTINEVQILPSRHPFTRLVSAYNDKFCMGKLFNCSYQGSHRRYRKVFVYGMWIPLLISSGRIEVNQDFYEALSNTIPLKGEGQHHPVNQNLLNIIQNRYSKVLQEISKKFNGIDVPFKDFINHIFWTYKHDVADHHWIPQTTLCDACRTSWSYVIHLENNEEESKYMLGELGFNKDTNMSKRNVMKNNVTPEYVNFFYDIPTSMIIKLVKYYYYDFLLLGYSW